ncbi:centromere protein R isoform 2-T2 [Discoglossus pictus]
MINPRYANEKSPSKTARQFSVFSPITGTRQMSPHAVVSKRQDVTEVGEHEESGMSSRGQSPQERNTEILELFAQVEKSLGTFLKVRQSLKRLKALEGSRELGNITGLGNTSNNLKAEVQKTKALICEAKKIKMR